MTPTPHGQVPEALIDLIDVYAETRHRCGGIYNAKTEAARKAVIEALSGVQALSAAPAVLSDEAILNRTGCIDYSPGTAEYDLELIRWYRTQIASPAPQQSRPLSHPNREIPGLAQGAAITSESPTPPAEQQVAPKAAPGDAIDEAMRERDDAVDFIDALLDEVLGHERPEWSNLYGRADALNDVQERMTALHKPAVGKAWGQFQSAMAAPQQESTASNESAYQRGYMDGMAKGRRDAETAPQPAPDCHHRPPCDECAALAAQGGK